MLPASFCSEWIKLRRKSLLLSAFLGLAAAAAASSWGASRVVSRC